MAMYEGVPQPSQELTVAMMTLFLERVREIPALTGDMRPQARPAVATHEAVDLVGHVDYFNAADMVQLPPGYSAPLTSES